MPTCNQTSGGLSPLTQGLYDNHTRSLYNHIGWTLSECPPPKPVEYEVVVIDETLVQIDGIKYTATINDEWVDFKEVRISGAICLDRQCHLDISSWEKMMELYNEGQTIFKIETNG